MTEDEASDAAFQVSLDQLESLFRTTIQLDFSRSSAEFAFPDIKTARSSAATSPSTEATRFFKIAASHFRYDDFFRPTAKRFLAWPCERITVRNGGVGSYCVTPRSTRAASTAPVKRVVNNDEVSASSWFREDIIAACADPKGRNCFVLRGEPGSGKSTFIKFLISECRDFSKQNGVVFSRFEASKYFRTEQPIANQDAAIRLAFLGTYITRLALRDLVVDDAFSFEPDGLVRNPKSRHFRNGQAIDNMLHEATQGLRENTTVHTRLFDALRQIVEQRCFQAWKIVNARWPDREFDEAVAAVVSLLSKNRRICTVFDGLDLIGVEDFTLDHGKNFVLLGVFALFGMSKLPPPNLGFENGNALIVVRDKTYQFATKNLDLEIHRTKPLSFEMAALDHRVVLYKSLQRACEGFFPNSTQEVKVEWLDRTYKTMRFVAANLAVELRLRGSDQALSVFNGNIRDCFEYFERVLNWILDEEFQVGYQTETSMASVHEFIQKRMRKSAMRSKAYRLIELLLRARRPHFVDRIVALSPTPDERRRDPDKRYKLEKNVSTEAFVDNIFNYTRLRREDNSVHYLMVKTRILQILQRADAFGATFLDIWAELRRFGYVSMNTQELWDALVILQHDGFISLHAMQDISDVEEQHAFSFSIMPKGRCVLDGLLYTSAYWEHVFHGTLFPVALLPTAYDVARVDSVKRWERQSIRNCFILLQYLRYVEGYHPVGTSMPHEFRVGDRVAGSLWRSIANIMRKNYSDSKNSPRGEELLVSQAIGDVTAMISLWQRRNLCLTKH